MYNLKNYGGNTHVSITSLKKIGHHQYLRISHLSFPPNHPEVAMTLNFVSHSPGVS